MDQVIIKTISCIQPTLAHAYKSCQPEDVENSMCFEILGFDILIDTKMKPWVLEVNISPSFSVDTPLDFRIKRGVIEESIKLLNLSYKRKLRFRKKEKSEFQKRVLTKRTERKTLEEKSLLKQNYAFKRNMKESEMIENYRLIYPNSETEQYEAYMRTAKIVWEEFTGSAKIEPKMSVKKEKHTVAAVQPIEFNDADEVKETKIANKNNEIKIIE